MRKTPFEAGGFAFPDEEMMERAVQEEEGIRYIKNSMDISNPQMVFEAYCQIVSQRLFETPPGYVYLYELQEFLRANPTVSNTDIPPIPVIAPEKKKARKPAEAARRQPVQKKVKEVKKIKNIDYKPRFRASLSVSIVLILIVIWMFAITATSENINIINYENALIEKYEGWEAKLNEREEKIKEREKMFGSPQ